jgi:catechol 2,3-dioxygenase-like lactoylglutathione lyase family enzyme
MNVRRIDHVGINVNDLPAATAFFVDLGLEVLGEGVMEGALLDRVAGLNDAKTAIVMLGTPDGQTNIELVKFYRPADEQGVQQHPANTLGIRHIALVVEDIDAVVAKLNEKGVEAFSAVQRYED